MKRLLIAAVVLASASACGTSTAANTPTTTVKSTTNTTSPAQKPKPTKVVASWAAWRLPFAIAREVVAEGPNATGSAVVAGGMLPGDGSTDKVFALDPITGSSTAANPLAVPVHDAAGGTYAGKPAVYGGGNTSEQSLVQSRTSTTWRKVDSMSTTRSDLSVAAASGSTYVIGGFDGTGVPLAILRQTGDGQLASAGQLKAGVRYAATAVIGSAIYVFGGEVNGRELDVVQRFDTITGRTAIVGHLPHPLGHAMAIVVDGRVLLMGGRTSPTKQTATMWWFAPKTMTWAHAGKLPAATSDAAVLVRGSRAWLLGGENPNVTDRVIQLIRR